ncbi:MAG: hypothetical protein ACODAA_07330 [Gemmatimonadota bacterium]
MQVQIRRISTSSAFLVGMALYALIGFLVGIVLVVVAGVEVPPGTEPSFVERMGVWAIVIVPAVFGIGAGFLHAIAAALYNTVTAVVGGVRVELGSGRPSRRERREEKRTATRTTDEAAGARADEAAGGAAADTAGGAPDEAAEDAVENDAPHVAGATREE